MEAKREFIIFVNKDIDWEIRLKDLNDYTKYPPLEYKDIDFIFPVEHATKDNKIAYLFEAIGTCKDKWEFLEKDKRFMEVCVFTDETSKKSFTGTFIEALKYIEKEMQDG